MFHNPLTGLGLALFLFGCAEELEQQLHGQQQKVDQQTNLTGRKVVLF